MPRHTASLWSTKTFGLPDEAQLRLGGGVVYSGKSVSTSPVWSIVTPSRTTNDALAEIRWDNWRFAVNATNLLGQDRKSVMQGKSVSVSVALGGRRIITQKKQ